MPRCATCPLNADCGKLARLLHWLETHAKADGRSVGARHEALREDLATLAFHYGEAIDSCVVSAQPERLGEAIAEAASLQAALAAATAAGASTRAASIGTLRPGTESPHRAA